MRQSYRTDLSDEQWELLEELIPKAKAGGRPRQVDIREVINAIFYLVSGGMAWHLLPHDFPKGKTVYHYFRQWRIDGDWVRIHDLLRQRLRVGCDREVSPSVAILDSQSVATATMMHRAVGFDANKKITLRKRHLLVDTLGLMIMVVVSAANVPEREGANLVFEKLHLIRGKFPRLVRIWVDGGYEGKTFMCSVMDRYRWIIETIKRSDRTKGFVLLPRRWVVERTFGWFNWYRRLSKDYECLPETSVAMIQVAMIRIMVRRLA
ncbi:MAG: IS5 family transposase [Tatlockia sp.]|nr:IS5 family transposase [Tatlockia sp.]